MVEISEIEHGIEKFLVLKGETARIDLFLELLDYDNNLVDKALDYLIETKRISAGNYSLFNEVRTYKSNAGFWKKLYFYLGN